MWWRMMSFQTILLLEWLVYWWEESFALMTRTSVGCLTIGGSILKKITKFRPKNCVLLSQKSSLFEPKIHEGSGLKSRFLCFSNLKIACFWLKFRDISEILKLTPFFSCPLPCEHKFTVWRNLFIVSCILNVCLLIVVIPFARRMAKNDANDALL